MRRKFLLAITFCMIFSFTACASNNNSSKVSEETGSSTIKESNGTINEETSSISIDSNEPKQEILDAEWDSGLLQINDKIIQLPINLNKLVELGFEYEIEYGRKSNDYLFAQNDKVTYTLMFNGESLSTDTFVKETEGFETIEDINPLIEKISMTSKTEDIKIYFPGGLTFDDSYKIIEDKLGQPLEINENMTYVYGYISNYGTDLEYGINISVSRDTQLISGFQIAKNTTENVMDELATITFENTKNVQTSDVHNISMLWVPEYKKVVGMLASGHDIKSVLKYDDEEYLMSLSFSMLAQKYASPYDYQQYGEPIYDVTDDNGMKRTVYISGNAYTVFCSTDVHILKATIDFNNMTSSGGDALEKLRDIAIEIVESIKY